MAIGEGFRTHEVDNQSAPLPPCNLWSSNLALQEAVAANAGMTSGRGDPGRPALAYPP